MDKELAIIWLIGVCCVLPIITVWLVIRKKTNETNKRTEIILSALEKNPELNVEEWLKKLAPKEKLIKEKLLTRLVWGIILLLIGGGFIAFGIYLLCNHLGGSDDPASSFIIGGVVMACGIALTINYFAGKKYLAKEIEAEEKEKIGNQL